MKKWITRVLIIFSVVLGLFIKVERINAQGLETISTGSKVRIKTKKRELDVYLDIIKLNGEHVYCIEPDTYLTNGEGYDKEVITPDDLTIEQVEYFSSLDYIWKIRYNSSYDVFPVIAMMIYESVEPDLEYYFYSGSITNSKYMEMKEKLNQEVKKLQTVPSFSNKKLDVEIGETISLFDNNESLNDFNISSDTDKFNYIVNENELKITGLRAGNSLVFGSKVDNEYLGTSFVYRKYMSQTLVSVKMFHSIDFSLEINVLDNKGILEIIKLNKNSKKPVAGTSFAISRNRDMSEPLGVYTTTDDGVVTINDLQIGKYYIQEQDTLNNLILDRSIHEVEILARQKVIFTKENDETTTKIAKKDKSTKEFVSGAEFELYSEDSALIDAWTSTDKERIIMGLNRGERYTLKEVNAPFGYKRGEEIEFFLNEDEDITYVIYENEKLEVVDTGIDRCTYIPIPMFIVYLLSLIRKRFI